MSRGEKYEGRTFVSVSNTANGEVSAETVFHYRQTDDLVWAEYSGGEILKGFLIGTCDDAGALSFTYQHLNTLKEVRTGKCMSRPEHLPDGRLRLHESWQWTSGDLSSGFSIVEERV